MGKRHRIIALTALLTLSGCQSFENARDRPPSATPAGSSPARERFFPRPPEPVQPAPQFPPRDFTDGPVTQGVRLKDSPATTNAAMAAGFRRNASDLRIPNEERRRPTEEVAGAPARPIDEPFVAPPAPMSESRTQGQTVSVVNPAPAHTPIRTVEEGQKRITDMGGLAPRNEQLPNGEWQFSCLVPNPKNVNVHRRYEGRDRDAVRAVQIVLDQIDEDQRKSASSSRNQPQQ